MQTQILCWFAALYVCLALNCCDCNKHKSNNARSKYIYKDGNVSKDSDDKPEGKIFGWHKQPQTNLIIITRPTAAATTPTNTVTTATITSPIITANRNTGSRPYMQRYGGFRRYNAPRRGTSQALRRRAGQKVFNRRRLWQYAREDEQNTDETPNHMQETAGFESVGIIRDTGSTLESAGVNSKLDIEQMEKSLLAGQPVINNQHDAGQIAVNVDELSRGYKLNNRKHLQRKSEKIQAAPIFASTMPATASFTTTSDAVDAANAAIKGQTYDELVVDYNGNSNKMSKNNKKTNNKNENIANERQSIWQGISQRWRERQKRRKNSAQNQSHQQQLQEYVNRVYANEQGLGEGEIQNKLIIDKNGKIHLKKKRQNNYNNNSNRPMNKTKTKKKHPKRKSQSSEKNNQTNKHKRPQQEDVTNIKTTTVNSLISENNTNSRLQNLMNAFRRTPIIYQKQLR